MSADFARPGIFAALLLLIFASTFGLWVNSENDHTSRLEHREDYADIFAAVATHPGSIPAELETRLHEIWTSNRAIDTHAHAANMAMIVLLFVSLNAIFAPRPRWPLVGLTLGALIYPAGLVIQVFNAEFIGQIAAALGAGMVVTFSTIMAAGFLFTLGRRHSR